MKKVNISILAGCIFMIASCHKSPEKVERDFLKRAIERIDVNREYQWIVILPGLGGHGCIQEAEVFMQQYIADRRILFVLTKISSLTILQQKTEVRIDEHPNIYVDRENRFDIPTGNRIYPCTVYMNDGKMDDYFFQCPGNNAFRILENVIALQQ
ncbi:MAG: hypothetical protein LBL07_20150 [Tannerella sp.]|jgi:hypothetical protein|nr:hypothetical protein [Tannerella sp.]